MYMVFFWRCDSILNTSFFTSFQTHVDERQVVEGIVKFQKAVSELPGMHSGAELWHDLRGLQTVVSQAICYKCEALLAVALQQGLAATATEPTKQWCASTIRALLSDAAKVESDIHPTLLAESKKFIKTH